MSGIAPVRPLTRRARGRTGAGDEGFTLIEVVVAIGLLALVLPAFAAVFISSTFASADAQLRNVAVTIADSALDQARAVSPPSGLLSHTVAGSLPSTVDGSQTVTPVTVSTTTSTVDGHTYTATTYAGLCYLQSSGSASGLCTQTPVTAAKMIRAIAYVTWPSPTGCTNQVCAYVDATLLSDTTDAQLEINANVLPSAPGSVTASPGLGSAVVSWSTSSSSFPITQYVVTSTPGGATCSTTGATSCTLTSLTGGTTYTITVTAISAAGESPASSAATVTPYSSSNIPSAPTGVTATAGSASVAVSWTSVSASPGVTGYTATASPGGQTCTTTGATTCTISGLTNGTTYAVTVTATNAAGTSPASTGATATPGNQPPSAPTAVTATAAESSAAISWGSVTATPAVTGYTATASPGSHTCTTTGATTCTISGLTDGTTYTVTVTAMNSAGTSPASSAVTVIPYPASIMTSGTGLSLWLDGADPKSFTANGCSAGSVPAVGAAVTCWGDKSPNVDYVYQSTSSRQPVMGTLNGHSAVTFNNTTSGSVLQYLVSQSSTGRYQTVFIALKPASTPNGTNYDYAFQLANLDTSIRLGTFSSPNANDWQYSTGTEKTDGVSNAVPSAGATAVIMDVSPYTQTNWITVGDSSTGTGWAYRGIYGTVGEVITFSGTLTSAQQSSIQSYLTNKWG